MKTMIPLSGAAILLGSFLSVAEAQTPIITAQPTNEVVLAGSTASFSVAVSGTGPLTYQWQFNGMYLPDGIIGTVVGNGRYGYSGDGGPATNAELSWPFGAAVDTSGNLFIADQYNQRIRKVETNGIITTVAGNGTNGYSGDGGPATRAELNYPNGVAVDGSGNLFIADNNNQCIREVGTNGIITTVAGNGTPGYSGDGGPATNAELNYPDGVAVDGSGNLFIADFGNDRIRKVGTNGIIITVAGNGTPGYSGDGGPATNAELGYTNGIALDASGNLFIADGGNQRIRKVGTNGVITTVAGNGTNGYSGDGGAATSAELDAPMGVAVDASGNLFIADQHNQRIREVGTNGMIITVAGNGTYGYSGDGGTATSAELDAPTGVAVDASGNLFIADTDNSVVRKVVSPSATLVLNNVSGANAGSYDVVVSSPYGSVTSSVVTLGVVLPPAIVRQPQSQWVALGSNATLSVAATGTAPLDYQWYFDGAPLQGQTNATLTLAAAYLTNAGSYDVSVTNLYGSVTSSVATLTVSVITEQPVSQSLGAGSNVTFSVTTVGEAPYSYQWFFDGSQLPGQTNSALSLSGVDWTNAGSYEVVVSNVYGSVTSAVAVLTVGIPPGITVQPVGETNLVQSTASFSVAVSGTGPFTYQWQFNGANLPDSIIGTVAGDGTGGYSGDGGPATQAELADPSGVAVDASGNLFIADTYNARIREVGTNGIISTVAGNGTEGYSGNGGQATNAELARPAGVAVDASGNLFIADWENQRVRKVGTNGIITTVAGNGTAAYSGDGGPATSAELNGPWGVAVDASGNLFIADYGNERIRKVGTNGIITTVAGNGTQGYSGDGGPATHAELSLPSGVAVDGSGNLFIADFYNSRIRKVGTNGIISTVAGNGTAGYSGDGGAATRAELDFPLGVTVDASGNLFIADSSNSRIRKMGTNGIITTVAGNGTMGYSGDGGAATRAELSGPIGVAVDASGDLFIGDQYNMRIRKVVFPGPTLVLNNVNGANDGSYDVVVSSPYGSVTSSVVSLQVAFPPALVTQPQSHWVVLGSNATLSVAATGTAPLEYQWYFDGAPLQGQTNTTLLLSAAAYTNAGSYTVVVTNLYASVTSAVAVVTVGIPPGITAQPVSRTNLVQSTATFSVAVSGTGPFTYQWQLNGTNLPDGIITTVAGDGTQGYSGDGHAATGAELNYPTGLAVDASGELFIADNVNYVIRKVGTNGIITTAAGGGTNGLGDGGPASNAQLYNPCGVAMDASGNLFIADLDNMRIRKIGTNGIITTVAGNGAQGYSGDGGPATNAKLHFPQGVAVDAGGNLFIADTGNERIRKVGTNGIITTVAGNGTWGYSGDGGPATRAEMNYPTGVAVDASGNLFIGDYDNQRIREVGTNGIITTVAGNGAQGYSGDGGPATNVELNDPFGVAVDASGNLFIADAGNGVIRKVGTDGIITTVAGNGTWGYSGDGGAATNAELYRPDGVAVDASGNLFIADTDNQRIREVVFPGPTLVLTDVGDTNAGAYDVVVSSPYGSVTSSVVILQVLNLVRYVNANSAHPAPPYTNWAAAATNIQDAVDAAAAGDEILVTNGIYLPVEVNQPLVLRSANGPGVTAINGGGAASCLSLNSQALIVGFTLTNGMAGNGGGVYCESTSAVLSNCVLTGNSAGEGGGAYGGTLNNCTVIGNWAGEGGGAADSLLNNCVLTGNSATNSGGGAYSDSSQPCTLNNCTVTGNSAGDGGGAYSCALNNCIVYFNTAAVDANYDSSSTLNYCCAMPMPLNGGGNITDDPELASASHLSLFSPCRGAGSAGYATGVDIDGEAWGTPPSIGCDEFHDGAVTGPLTVRIAAAYTNVAVGFPLGLTAGIEGRTTLSLWDFGDGTQSLDQPYTAHAWTATGEYPVELWAFNESHPEGVKTTMMVHVMAQPVYYVALSNSSPLPPYGSWASAATNIQDAVNAASVAGSLVWVSNGVYQTVVAVTKPVTVQSVNGPRVTVIDESGGGQCVYLANNALLVGFTLANGSAENGGGVYCESDSAMLSDCVLSSNSAWNDGGGAYGGTLNNCTLTGNWAYCGGGAYGGTLNNCTLTDNGANYGGGAYGGALYDCTLTANAAYTYTSWDCIWICPQYGGFGGGADSSTLNNCTLATNSARDGGGAYDGTLNNCTLTGNLADLGGGAYSDSSQPCTLNNCTLTGNWAYDGGGAADSTLINCTLTGNSAEEGGGAYSDSMLPCTLNNCTLTGNSADDGGGAADATLNNCALTGNWATNFGGGAYSDSSQPCTLNNCTLTGNSADDGGGVYSCTLDNCILYYNNSPGTDANYDESSRLNYCCTAPLPGGGRGNISADPQLASAWLLSAHSPCIGAGSTAYVSGTDIEGEPWANPPSIGCEEFYAGAMIGPLSVAIEAEYTNVVPGLPLNFTAQILGQPSASSWDFGDGTVVSNLPYASHAWTAIGDFPVILRAYNDTYPGGVAATVTVRVMAQPVYYVALSNTSPEAPFGSWATAATNIQEAVDATSVAGTLVLVTNGVYPAGIAVTKPVTLRSVNGPGVTVINGGGVAGCLYLTNDAMIVGFTLTNGWAEDGGGVYCESISAVVSNCVLTGNSAWNVGGGAYGGTLNNCTLSGNSAPNGGGAADSTLNNCALTGNVTQGDGGAAYSDSSRPCTLNNCTLTGNSASTGGGAYSCALNNCIVYFNSAPNGSNYDPSCALCYCCTTPLPSSSVGNISADPQLASASHLSAESPCIGAGSARYASGTDIDGDAWANPPSIGCDEYHAGTVTGPLTVSLTATFTNVAIGYPVDLTAFIQGRTDLSVWAFGDGSVQVNEPYTSHTWTAPGDYVTALWAYNDSYPEGVSATMAIHVDEGLHYVAATSGNPVAPYTSWATAARIIQDAVDVAGVGGTVFVTNGTYAAGGRTTPATGDGLTNRVVVDTPLTVRSVNGPGVTVIQGLLPGATNGEIRCVYLANAATLAGFTLTNGEAGLGGGVYCQSASAVLSNCVLSGNSASDGGGASGGTLDNCTLTGNSADWSGGGAESCTLNNCTLTANSAWNGGGADGSTLKNCTLTGNWGSGASGGTLNNCTLTGNSAWNGGGAYDSTLNNCTLTGNSAAGDDPYTGYGGGAYGGTLDNCTLSSNEAGFFGGAASASVLNNCALSGNSADYGGGASGCTVNNSTLTGNSAWNGGGAYGGTLNNCTLTGNLAYYDGGGVDISMLNNCIVYFNSDSDGGNYDSYSTLNYCCTAPLPGGAGNITNAPLFVNSASGNLRLQSNSPCINSGNNAYVVGSTDLDGNPRIVGGTVDIGAYEYQTPLSMISYAWLQQYGLPINTNTDTADLDGTGMNVYQDWIAGLNPTNALSVLQMTSATPTNNATGLVVTWQSVSGIMYFLQSSTNLAAQPAFSTIQSNIAGQAGTTSYTDTTATNAGPYFYRVGVGN
jgi:sugar lactone lactonase YvrE